MLDKEFLETYPLYKEFKIDLPTKIEELKLPSIDLYCKDCGSFRSFVVVERRDMLSIPIDGHIRGISENLMNERTIVAIDESHLTDDGVLNITYMCVGCKSFKQHYSIKMNGNDTIMKIGQYPPWNISIDKDLKGILGEYEGTYKKGLICESQGYGIGAYAYYRRIIEDIIDELLNQLTEIIDDENKEDYLEKVEELKGSHNAKNKIAVVKELLPNSLKLEGKNPLGTLYSSLSTGIHNLNDDETLEIASFIRRILIFLVKEIINHREANKDLKVDLDSLLKKINS